MTSPALRAHVRILEQAQLVVRTHERAFYSHRQGSKLTPQVIVDNRTYRSRLAVRQHFRIGAETLNDWLRTGRARFA